MKRRASTITAFLLSTVLLTLLFVPGGIRPSAAGSSAITPTASPGTLPATPIPAVPRSAPQLTSASTGCVSDEFSTSPLSSAWTIVDPLSNSTFDLTANPGNVRIQTLTGNHDMNAGLNTNAPRVVQTLSGDFDVNTKVNTVYTPGGFQAAGLLVWFDNNNFVWIGRDISNSIAHHYFRGGQELDPPSVPGISNATVYFRIARNANTLTTYYNLDGSTNWIQTGSIDYPSASVSSSVGLLVMNQWADNPIYADFEYFRCGVPLNKAFVSIQSPDSVAVLDTTTNEITQLGVTWPKAPGVGVVTPDGSVVSASLRGGNPTRFRKPQIAHPDAECDGTYSV